MRRMLLLICLLPVAMLSAQSNIEMAVRQGQITAAEGLELRVQQLYNPAGLPAIFQSEGQLPLKSGTDVAYAVRHAADKGLTASTPLMKRMLSRPTTDASMVSPSGLFRVHYDTSGSNAVDLTDDNSNGLPDYIDAVAQAYDYSYALVVEEMEYQPPRHDDGVDGGEWDVYVRNLGGVYGYTNFESKNPDGSWSCYVEMDNDYIHTPTRGIPAAQVTAAHEFFHMVQLGYQGRDDDDNGSLDDHFIMEAASTWMEDAAYTDVNDYYFYLPQFFSAINRPFHYPYGLHMYGLGIWFHYLRKEYGGSQIIREFWEEIEFRPAYQALEAVFARHGSSLVEEMSRFYGWNYLTGDRADTDLAYPEGEFYPMVNLSGQGFFDQDTSFYADVQATAVRYYAFNQGSNAVAVAVINGQWQSNLPGTQTGVALSTAPLSGFEDLGGGYYAKLEHVATENWQGVGLVGADGDISIVQFDVASAGPVSDDAVPPFPNPFIPREHAVARILIPEHSEEVTLSIFSTAGHRLKKVLLNENAQQYAWTGDDDEENAVASGVYIILIEEDGKDIYKEKILLVR